MCFTKRPSVSVGNQAKPPVLVPCDNVSSGEGVEDDGWTDATTARREGEAFSMGALNGGTQSNGGSQPTAGPRVQGRLWMELAIIFAGVFGAFVAEDVRQQREDDRRALQIYEALLGEVRIFSERAPHVTDVMRDNAAGWSRRRAAGEFPAPAYYREPDAETPPTAIWEATLASGGVALLEPRLFNELANFYNRLGSVSDRYLRYNRFTEDRILPFTDTDPAVFYGDGNLRGEYRAHMERLEEIEADLRARIQEAHRIEQLLEGALAGR